MPILGGESGRAAEEGRVDAIDGGIRFEGGQVDVGRNGSSLQTSAPESPRSDPVKTSEPVSSLG